MPLLLEDTTFVLPELKEESHYARRFVFSNITKMLSLDGAGHKRAGFGATVAGTVRVLGCSCRMQLSICPDSTEHHDESLMSQLYEELKHTYEHFSTGISFSRSTSIQDMQIVQAFGSWLKMRAETLSPIRVASHTAICMVGTTEFS